MVETVEHIIYLIILELFGLSTHAVTKQILLGLFLLALGNLFDWMILMWMKAFFSFSCDLLVHLEGMKLGCFPEQHPQSCWSVY